MLRRKFFGAGAGIALMARAEPDAGHVTVYESPDPSSVFAGSAGLARTPSGRLIATMNLRGPGVAKLPDVRKDEWQWSSRIYSSDDRGRSWKFRGSFPMNHARPFCAGGSVYILGHGGKIVNGKYMFDGDVAIVRSKDNGESWSAPAELTRGQIWHQAPCNVHFTRGRVYLVMERVTDPTFSGWNVAVLAPVLLSADASADLTRRDSWVFSNELSFMEAVRQYGRPRMVGAPFHAPGPTEGKTGRVMAPPGWLETNVVQFTDPAHVWFDPAQRTFHLWMRAHTGSTNVACVARALESADSRAIEVSLEKAPSGEPMLYVPCPGGHMKFHIVYDDQTRLFWLLSNQSTDSMRKPEALGSDRFGLPNNERHRLALHFSTNCIDWCFAAMVANSGHPRQARHYASMVIDGEDLHVLSRSGDGKARSAHDGNLITFHTVRRFRALVY